MRRFLLDLLPQVLDRVEIRRVGGQLLNGQARHMGIEKLLHGLARMITRAILNHDDVASSLRQHVEQKGRIASRVKASLMRFVEKLAGEIVDQAKDLVALSFATRCPFRKFCASMFGARQRVKSWACALHVV